MFQSAPANPAGGSMFQTTQQPSTTMFGAQPQVQTQAPQFQQQQQQQFQQNLMGQSVTAQSKDPTPQEKLQLVINGWKGDAFQCVFYNVEDDPNRIHLYNKPPNCSDAVWNKALRDNPQPDRFVPAIAVGFDDVKARVDAQTAQAAQHQAKLAEISKQLNDTTSKVTLTTSTRLSRASTRQVQLASRLLRLLSRLHPLNSKGQPLRKGEEELKINLEKLWMDLVGKQPAASAGRTGTERRRIVSGTHTSSTSTTSPSDNTEMSAGTSAGAGKMASVLNELLVITSQRKAIRESVGGRASTDSLTIREEDIKRILEVLEQQQKTLDHLSKTVSASQVDLDVIRGGFGLTPLNEDASK